MIIWDLFRSKLSMHSAGCLKTSMEVSEWLASTNTVGWFNLAIQIEHPFPRHESIIGIFYFFYHVAWIFNLFHSSLVYSYDLLPQDTLYACDMEFSKQSKMWRLAFLFIRLWASECHVLVKLSPITECHLAYDQEGFAWFFYAWERLLRYSFHIWRTIFWMLISVKLWTSWHLCVFGK